MEHEPDPGLPQSLYGNLVKKIGAYPNFKLIHLATQFLIWHAVKITCFKAKEKFLYAQATKDKVV
jgi:hypothetical protein